MLATSTPIKIPLPWANSASGSYITYPVPTPSQTGITNGAASFTDGFPPNCFVPVASGGAGPFGKDFNGILKQLSAGLQWAQAVGIWKYDGTFSTTIGGYPNGALVQSATTAGRLWLSTADNNTTNPDTGGAGWVIAPSGTWLGTRIFNTGNTPPTTAYTPTHGTVTCYVRMCGGGGSGASCTAASANQCSTASGGDGGAYAEGPYAVGTLSGQLMTIGVGGAAPTAGNHGGNVGGDSLFGGVIDCPGGAGGQVQTDTPTPGFVVAGTTPSMATGGTAFNGATTPGGAAIILSSGSSVLSLSGFGGSSPFGGSSARGRDGGSVAGFAGSSPGAGGGGANSVNGGSAAAGGAGADGLILVDEFS